MATVTEDAYGHRSQTNVGPLGAALAAAAVGVVTPGTIAGTTNAGAAPTVTGVSANDMAGTFTLNPVTGGGAQAAGAVATVTYSQPLSAVPKAVIAQVINQAGDVAVLTAVKQSTITGFSICTSVLTTANSYTVQYVVIP
jgi:hypothetical protein